MVFVERLHWVRINITLEEHVAIREAAKIAELTMNEYMRRVLLPQAQLDAGDISQILEEIHKSRAAERAKQPPSTWGGLPPELQ